MAKWDGSLVFPFIFVIGEICEISVALTVAVVPGHCPKLTAVSARHINCNILGVEKNEMGWTCGTYG